MGCLGRLSRGSRVLRLGILDRQETLLSQDLGRREEGGSPTPTIVWRIVVTTVAFASILPGGGERHVSVRCRGRSKSQRRDGFIVACAPRPNSHTLARFWPRSKMASADRFIRGRKINILYQSPG